MKLVSLELNNFCQHEHFTCRFSPGLNGIVGANGSGKSNILAAIKYAISGNTNYTIDDCIRIGSTGDSSVKLDFTDESGQHSYSIFRKLNMPRTVVLTTPNGTIRGCSKVAEFFEGDFGADFNILKSVQVVSQDEWVSLFKLPAAARATLLQRIFACDFLKTKREQLRQFLSSFNPLSNFADTIKVYKELLAEKQYAKNAYCNVPDTASAQTNLRDAMDEQTELNSTLTGAEHFKAFVDEIKRIDTYLENNPAPEHDYTAECQEASDKLREYEESLKEANESLTDSNDCLAFCEALEPPYATIDSHKEELNSLLEEMTGGQSASASIDKVNSLEDRLRQLSLSSVESRCHVCGCPLNEEALNTVKTKVIEKLNAEKEKLSKREATLKRAAELYAECNPLREEISSIIEHAQFRGKHIVYASKLNLMRPGMTGLVFGTDRFEYVSGSSDALEHIKLYKEDSLKAVQEATNTISEINSKIEAAREDVARFTELYGQQVKLTMNRETATNRRKELMAYVEKYPQYTDVNVDDLKTKLSALKTKIIELTSVRDAAVTRDNIVNDIASLQTKIADAKSKVASEEERTDRKQTLEGVVNLLSPDKFPRAVVLGWLRVLESSINTYLESFNAEYVAKVQNDTDIYCEFPAKTVPSWALSGGQQVVLAIAWRLALHNTFARSESCGFLTLDEPTTFLDTDNINNFVEVMSGIKTIADSNNLQIIVITHAQSLSPLFDNVIRLEK